MAQRVIAYIDGFNLYFGLRSQKLQSFYWLDVHAMVARLLERDERLELVKYFTSRISAPPDKVQRQTKYIEALQARPGVEMRFGHYLTHDRTCPGCGLIRPEPREKQTDVNIAVEMLVDAHRDRFDTAVVVSADSDLVPAIVAVKQLFPSKRLLAFFPPGRGSDRLEEEVHGKRRIRQWIVQACQLPDEVIGLDGYPRKRPPEWSGSPNDANDPPA